MVSIDPSHRIAPDRTATWHAMLAVLATLSFAPSPAHPAPDDPGDPDVGERYLDSLYGHDFDEVAALLHPDATFEDPTAVAFDGEALRATGRDAVVDFWRQVSEGVVDGGYRITSSFSAGGYLVLNVEYRSTFEGELMGVPGRLLSMEVPAVTVLRIEDGLVLSHTDYVDYALLHEQVAEQSR